MTGTWPADPDGDMTHILTASVEVAMARHPSSQPAPSGGFTLTAADRCDTCPAAAAYRVRKERSTLDFCAHHWRRHFPAMADQGWTVIGGNPTQVGKL
jgi:hypothetical protein